MNIITKSFKNVNINNSYKIPSNTIVWFTDGSCSKNGKANSIGGYASVCVSGYKHGTYIIGKVDDRKTKATNIRAEGLAILNTLNYIHSNIKDPQWDQSIIYSDSEFWIKMIYNYMPNWTIYKFSEMSNPDLTKAIYDKWIKINNSNKKIQIIHTYAHNKKNGKESTDAFTKFCYDNNDIADQLAVYARDISEYETYGDFC
jgi:ribonuclease HI